MIAATVATRWTSGRFRYGIALLGAGRPADAIVQLERALALEPGHAGARAMLARARAEAGS